MVGSSPPLYTEHSNDSFGVISTKITTTRPQNRFTTWDRQSTYDKYIATVYQTLGQQRKNKNKSIKAYLEQHGYMPMWVLMNVLTFGNVSHLFTLQKKEVQLNIIREMNLITLPSISNETAIVNTSRIIQILSIYRNICAHNERFYNTEIKVPIDDCFMGFGKKLPNYVEPGGRIRLNQAQRNKRLNARKGIYVLIFIISLFMDKKELDGFVNEILNEFKILKKSLDNDTYNEVVRLMGLKFDWYKLIKNN